jgi:hypothetical protein
MYSFGCLLYTMLSGLPPWPVGATLLCKAGSCACHTHAVMFCSARGVWPSTDCPSNSPNLADANVMSRPKCYKLRFASCFAAERDVGGGTSMGCSDEGRTAPATDDAGGPLPATAGAAHHRMLGARPIAEACGERWALSQTSATACHACGAAASAKCPSCVARAGLLGLMQGPLCSHAPPAGSGGA